MPFYADLHIHSHYSRATSGDCDLVHIALFARRKGLTVVATGDITHPAWLGEIEEKLVADGSGLYRLRPDLEREVEHQLPPLCRGPVRYILSGEIATIYSKGGRTRKVHHVVYFPDIETARRFDVRLATVGSLTSDGRPILGLDSRDLLEMVLEAGDGAFLIPAHIWTPWFAALGSKSGFDSIDECYGDLACHIFAVETGLSSDPPMNWRVSLLDRYRLVSNSDAHSPAMLGREACVFHTDLDYFAMRRALETGDGWGGTVEFFPEEGKYHLDGHRACGVRFEPGETRDRGGLCPVCGKPVTVGVMHRVELLADRPAGVQPPKAAPFVSLVPLPEIVAEIRGVGPKTRGVAAEVEALIARLGPELAILTTASEEALGQAGSSLFVEAVRRLRAGKVIREAGYDGEYGVIRLFEAAELRRQCAVASLFERENTSPEALSARRPEDAGGGASCPAHASSALVAGGSSSLPEEAPSPRYAQPASSSGVREPCCDTSSHEPSSHEPEALRTVGALPPADGRPSPAAEHPPLAIASLHPSLESPILVGLDPDQRLAAATTRGPLLILAGPGTGKTRTLTRRLAHLVLDHGVAPEHCLAVTFTRKAAHEMRERLEGLLPGLARKLTVTTFHGLGLAILREYGDLLGLPPQWSVADEATCLRIAEEATGLGERQARGLIEGLRPGSRRRRLKASGLEERFRAALRAQRLLNYDDLIALPVTLLEQNPSVAATLRQRYQWISIDEYQDIDEHQYRLVRLLTTPASNLCAVGDPDQAIYGFRGADVGFFLRFREDYPTVRIVHLTRNYRSSRSIVEAALQAIRPETLVEDRRLESVASGADGPITIYQARNEIDEGHFVAKTIERLMGGASFYALDTGLSDGHQAVAHSFADFAVLARTTAQLRLIADCLDRAGIPSRLHSHTPLTERLGVAHLVSRMRTLQESSLDPGSASGTEMSVLALLRAAAEQATSDPTLDPETARLVHEAVFLIEPIAERCGDAFQDFLDEVSLGTESDSMDPRADAVALLTLHAAKGLEFPVVFLIGCEDNLLPFRPGGSKGASTDEPSVAEERRLFFVGMTRAKERLYLTWALRRNVRGRTVSTRCSPFLSEIEDALLRREANEKKPGRPPRKQGDQLKLL